MNFLLVSKDCITTLSVHETLEISTVEDPEHWVAYEW